MGWVLSTFLVLFVKIAIGQDSDISEAAHIVASKFTLSQYAVEGMDYVVDYRLYNVGDKVLFSHSSFIPVDGSWSVCITGFADNS